MLRFVVVVDIQPATETTMIVGLKKRRSLVDDVVVLERMMMILLKTTTQSVHDLSSKAVRRSKANMKQLLNMEEEH